MLLSAHVRCCHSLYFPSLCRAHKRYSLAQCFLLVAPYLLACVYFQLPPFSNHTPRRGRKASERDIENHFKRSIEAMPSRRFASTRSPSPVSLHALSRLLPQCVFDLTSLQVYRKLQLVLCPHEELAGTCIGPAGLPRTSDASRILSLSTAHVVLCLIRAHH